MLETLSSPGSDSYKAVEKAVVADAGADDSAHTRRMVGRMRIAMVKRAGSVQDELKEIMSEIAPLLKKACGEGLAACSWEMAMKAYILSFP